MQKNGPIDRTFSEHDEWSRGVMNALAIGAPMARGFCLERIPIGRRGWVYQDLRGLGDLEGLTPSSQSETALEMKYVQWTEVW